MVGSALTAHSVERVRCFSRQSRLADTQSHRRVGAGAAVAVHAALEDEAAIELMAGKANPAYAALARVAWIFSVRPCGVKGLMT